MISKAIFLDVWAVYAFSLYTSKKGQPEEMQSRKLYSKKGDLFLNMLINLAQIVPLVYIFSPGFDFADYHLSLWFSLLSVLPFSAALWFLGKGHSAKAQNFPRQMELREDQTVMGQSGYHYYRNPAWIGFWLWSIAQPMLLHNWIAGFSMLVIFLPLSYVRVLREEKLLRGRFGEVNRKCTEQTGRIIPIIKNKLQGSGIGGKEKVRD